MNAFEGRGAPEVDVLEAMPGSGALKYGMKKPYYSASYQVAPGIEAVRPVEGKKPDKGTWYEDGLRYGPNTSMNYFFYGEELKHDRKSETYVADAISANTMLSTTHFEEFHTYRLEWETAKGKEALKWYLDDDFILEIDQSALHKTGAKMPDEPMHVLLNTAVSSTWGFPAPCPAGCDCACYDCGNPKCACALPTGFCDMLPAGYEIDSVRVYQRADEPTHKLGCSTDSKPTKHFIDGHKKRYFDKWSGETQSFTHTHTHTHTQRRVSLFQQKISERDRARAYSRRRAVPTVFEPPLSRQLGFLKNPLVAAPFVI